MSEQPTPTRLRVRIDAGADEEERFVKNARLLSGFMAGASTTAMFAGFARDDWRWLTAAWVLGLGQWAFDKWAAL